MKRTISILLVVFLLFSSSVIVSANSSVSVLLDGEALSFDVPAQIINDRTMVPLRAIFEALGASVEWDDATKTVTSIKDDTIMKFTIGDYNLYVNQEIKVLDVPPQIVDSRTLVPVRAVSESFGCDVDWWDSYRTVSIVTDHKVMRQKFVEFVKDKGSLSSDGSYYIQAPRLFYFRGAGESSISVSLVYYPATDALELQVYEDYFSSTSRSSQSLIIDLPQKSNEYQWEFEYETRNSEYPLNAEGTLKANAESYSDADAIAVSQILTDREISVENTASDVASLMRHILSVGEKMFSVHDSLLSFYYFGLQ